jgi:hypothetical protein
MVRRALRGSADIEGRGVVAGVSVEVMALTAHRTPGHSFARVNHGMAQVSNLAKRRLAHRTLALVSGPLPRRRGDHRPKPRTIPRRNVVCSVVISKGNFKKTHSGASPDTTRATPARSARAGPPGR